MIRDSIASACTWLWVASLIVAAFLPHGHWTFDYACYASFVGFMGWIVAMLSR